jgi:hypothetical protein
MTEQNDKQTSAEDLWKEGFRALPPHVSESIRGGKPTDKSNKTKEDEDQ